MTDNGRTTVFKEIQERMAAQERGFIRGFTFMLQQMGFSYWLAIWVAKRFVEIARNPPKRTVMPRGWMP